MNSHEPIETTEKLFARHRSRYYKIWIRLGIYFLIIGLFAFLFGTGRLDRLESLVQDGFMKYASWGQADPRIALIEISESAIEEVGPWPWPRSYHAIMVRLLSEWNAGAIVLDLDLSEPTEPKEDLDLAQVLSKVETPVYLPVGLKPQKEKKFWVHGMPVVLDKGIGKKVWVHALPEFQKRVQGVGHDHLEPDRDGMLRHFDPMLDENGERQPFLPLRAAYDQLKEPLSSVDLWKPFGNISGRVPIPWQGSWGRNVERYSYADLIHSFYAIKRGLRPIIDPAKIDGKICLIGLTAPDIAELKITPVDPALAKIEVYAQVLNAALTGQWVRAAPLWVNLLCLLALGFLTVALFVFLRGTVPFLLVLLLGSGWIGFSFIVFAKWHWMLHAVYPVLLMLCLFIFSAIYIQMTAMREKSHLFHLATRDGLTDLYVIRHFRLIMNQLVLEASLRKQPLSVILLDVDHFKKINDTYGHPAGDMVLKKTAALLVKFIRQRRPFREIDFAARYGGEEFIIILRKAKLKEAAEIAAERIRKEIADAKFEWEGKLIPVTISLGVATLHSGENVPDPMVHRADAALYKAKEGGRNRVCSERS